MASWQALESEKQSSCREQNEATAQLAGGAFRCECGDARCIRAISLTTAEYAGVRSYATHFVVAPNHENPESERVIEENERYTVVETVTGDATKSARKSDPRQRRRELCWS